MGEITSQGEIDSGSALLARQTDREDKLLEINVRIKEAEYVTIT